MIFDSALEKYCKITDFQPESSAESPSSSAAPSGEGNVAYDCKLLFRGVVHECDKMIRVRNNDVPNATPEEMELLLEKVEKSQDGQILPLSLEFHLIYAKSLYFLSLLEEKTDGNQNESLDFINESMYRAGVASDMATENNVEIQFVLVRGLVQKALITQDLKLATEIMEKSDSVFKHLKEFANLDSALELGHLITTLIGLFQHDLPAEMELAKTVAQKWKMIIERIF